MILRCLLVAWLLGAAAVAGAASVADNTSDDSSFTYNSYMASLSTAPQPINNAYGHFHALTDDDLLALDTADGQMLLVTLKECSAFAPHYQTNCAEIFYVKSGKVDAVMVVDGEVLQRTLSKGDVMSVPKGALHAFSNQECEESEVLIVLTSSDPDFVYPADQLMGLPQQAQISSFGVTNFSEFQSSLKVPRAHIYSLNDEVCTATCEAAAANKTGVTRPAVAGGGGKAAPAPAPAATPRRSLLRAALAAGRGLPARRLSAASGSASSARSARGSAAALGTAAAGAGRRAPGRLLAEEGGGGGGDVYNDFMASVTAAPATVDNDYAEQWQLTYDDLPGLEEANSEVTFTRFRPCSTYVPHFQPNADEFVTVLTAALGLEGGVAAVPGWQDTIDVPKATLASLNDPQCTERCHGSSTGSDAERTQVLSGTSGGGKASTGL
ncbi:hypothetical protein CHLNCDRAFT_58866 [Chlorella variabilis]|uniref:Cupin type-1 domain-containing protein n=1 Tax=Chlorella variabilis TaxID=554065 RepID=E1ZP85_CHLVA|nr:hypothetical protein CHLNCDRAFT_58866 [Chlorella variabilis]EFN52495.1 hypothetical protein CHLNCDRAFT_58866 [Chlorella variabilis]|eukprot:XP_005844597.1 hypothetical protein CHLNCDRAFT_58866 [Chlorella variabilis]